MHMAEQILILDFGSQYTQLIARRVRELDVYCEIHPYNKIPPITSDIKGVILSGSPCSVKDSDAPDLDLSPLRGKLPLLGVCYGAQLMAQKFGGEVKPSDTREYGRARLSYLDTHSPLLKEMTHDSQVWMSHGDTIKELPEGFDIIASTQNVKVAAYQVQGEETFGIQFHPEVTHSEEGKNLLRNFVVQICDCAQDWTSDVFIDATVASLKESIGKDRVVMGLSGGVDSSVAATLIHRAIGDQLTCVFVDNGLLRKMSLKKFWIPTKEWGLMSLVWMPSRSFMMLWQAYQTLKEKKAIGKTFIEVFDDEAHKLKM